MPPCTSSPSAACTAHRSIASRGASASRSRTCSACSAQRRSCSCQAVERGFERIAATFTRAAAEFDPATFEPDADVLHAMGTPYVELLSSDRDYLLLQHHAYAACDDPEIRERVRSLYARLVAARRAARRRPGRRRADRRVLPLRHVDERRLRRWASRTCRPAANGCGPRLHSRPVEIALRIDLPAAGDLPEALV